jgi:16S rRNA A1518/A1519 N6-dimethyltransferase RsmA/KsgA/DIM1 with predicted DNA glycosylase/AP lyase activity
MDPPSPFAELLRRVFAPEIDPLEVALMTEAFETEDNALCVRSDAMRAQWQTEVVDRFAARYKLWAE